MGLSKAFEQVKAARRTIKHDTNWALSMVKELKSKNIESFVSEEALLDELETVLESLLETINQ